LSIARELEKDMHSAAKAQDFETAASLRNKLQNLRSLQQQIMFGDKEFLDISKDKALSKLVDLFSLKKIPVRIEGYDISHMGGTNVVASMVVFTNGVSDRANYRKFKTRIEQNDDYYNMHETLQRRLSEKNLKSWGVPDLILIDGGKGQLDASIKALEERDLKIPIISIAKREEEVIVHRTRSNIDTQNLLKFIELPTPDVVVMKSGDYLIVNLHAGQLNASGHSKNLRGSTIHSSYSDVTKLFQRIRDESHRFAVSYHTVLKRAKQTANLLEEIPGVGPATRRKLMKAFGSMRAVATADEAAVAAVVGEKKAKLILPLIKPQS